MNMKKMLRRVRWFAVFIICVAIGLWLFTQGNPSQGRPSGAAAAESSAALPQLDLSDAELPNVVFITIDTLRADHLSSYGYHLRTSPVIDQLAAEGVRFTNANTVVPRTGPSHISMFTSRYPQEHGARLNGFAVPQDAKWLFVPQILQRFGYTNAGFVSAWVLADSVVQLDRWFDHWDQTMNRSYQFVNSMRWAEDVTPAAIEWLEEQRKSPFFLWVHYFDPHSPYELREGFEVTERIGEEPPIFKTYDDEMRSRVRNYDAEVRYTDHWVGELLKSVDELGLRDNTLVVLLSDHGESLGEHGYQGHGRALYENIVRVPLIFRWPGKIPEGKVIEHEVTLLDLAPTLIDLTVRPYAKEPIPDTFRGKSLAPAWNGEPWEPGETIRYITWAGQRWVMPSWISRLWLHNMDEPLRVGYARDGRKVVWEPREEEVEVTDLKTDPDELRSAEYSRDSAVYERETAAMEHWHDITNKTQGESKMSESDREALKSLGYLQ